MDGGVIWIRSVVDLMCMHKINQGEEYFFNARHLEALEIKSWVFTIRVIKVRELES